MTDHFRILVVDDERLSRSTAAQVLQGKGYDAEPVGNASAALQRLETGRWDVLVTDLHPPGLDGMVFLRRIREQHPEVAVLVLTPAATVETAVAAVQAGAADYLIEPFKPEELELRLDRLCRRGHAHATHAALDTGALFTLHLEGHDRLPFNDLLERFQDELIHWALAKAGGQQKRAADLLGIPRTTLQSRMLRLKTAAHT